MDNAPGDDRGSDAKFASLMAAHGGAVRAFVSTLLPDAQDRDDTIQETHLALWSNRTNYDWNRPFVKWACGVAHKKVLRYRHQKAKNRLLFSDETVQMLATDVMNSLGKFDQRGAALEHCLQSLKPGDLRLIEARYRFDTSVESIATELGRTESALYKALKRIRESLRDCVLRALHAEYRDSSHMEFE